MQLEAGSFYTIDEAVRPVPALDVPASQAGSRLSTRLGPDTIDLLYLEATAVGRPSPK
ncbi:MAG: hypothetical protein ACM3NQ_08580 [Bacteroidales bacterium]